MRTQVGTLRGGPSASCPVFVSVALASSGWLSRGRSRGRSTQLTITPQVRRQMLRHTQGGAPLTACYSPSRDRAERAYVPPYGGTTAQSADRSASATRAQPAQLRASAASRGCYNPRRSAARPARVGRVDRAPPALAGCGVVVWVFTPLLQPAAVVCVLVLRSRRGRDWTGFRAGSSRPPGCVSRGCSARWGYRCGSSRRRRARRSSCSSPPSSAPPPRIARRRAWPPSRRPP
jgi:hypothetical protein